MTYSIRPPVNPRFTSPPDELDGVLRRYFLAQLPQPWPAPPRLASDDDQMPAVPPRLAGGRFFCVATRCAVAAAVAFLVVGYLALQGWFPDPRPAKSSPLVPGIEMGRKLTPGHSIDRTPSGQRVGVDVQQSPNDPKSFIIRVEPLPAKK